MHGVRPAHAGGLVAWAAGMWVVVWTLGCSWGGWVGGWVVCAAVAPPLLPLRAGWHAHTWGDGLHQGGLCQSAGARLHLAPPTLSCVQDGMFTLGEMECMGACVNAPMVAIAGGLEASSLQVLFFQRLPTGCRVGSSCTPASCPFRSVHAWLRVLGAVV